MSGAEGPEARYQRLTFRKLRGTLRLVEYDQQNPVGRILVAEAQPGRATLHPILRSVPTDRYALFPEPLAFDSYHPIGSI